MFSYGDATLNRIIILSSFSRSLGGSVSGSRSSVITFLHSKAAKSSLLRASNKPLEVVVADEHAAQAEEGVVDVRPSFVAHAPAPKAVEPGARALDHPAVAAQMPAAVLPAPGDAGDDPACPQRRPAAGKAAALVGVQLLGAEPWPASRSGDGRHRVDGLLQHPRVMHVGRREHGSQRPPATLYHNVALRARAAALDRTRAGFLAPFLRRDRARVQTGAALVELVGIGQALQKPPVQDLLRAGRVPVAQASPAGHPRAAAHLRGEQLPRCARAQPKDNAREHGTIREARSPTAGTRRDRRQ